jgi:hypothetical protein
MAVPILSLTTVLIFVLPSENEGRAVQHVALRSNAIISTDAITSDARLVLVYRLWSDASLGAEIDRNHHPDTPATRNLKQDLSAWVPVADMSAFRLC